MAVHPLRPATDHWLGGPLPHQLPNRTRAHLSPDCSFDPWNIIPVVSCGIRAAFAALSPCERQVAHALLTRPPLKYPQITPWVPPLDLHVLGTPPAFVLSQDQTLVFNPTACRIAPGLSPFSPCRRPSLRSIESTVVSSLLFSVSFSRSPQPRLGCPMNIPHTPNHSQAEKHGIMKNFSGVNSQSNIHSGSWKWRLP